MRMATFKKGQRVAYQDKGIGKITSIGEVDVGGFRLNVIIIEFQSGIIKIPVKKALENGLRLINTEEQLPDILKILKKKSKKGSGGGWRAKADILKMKLTSGELLLIAEVVHQLYREDGTLSVTEKEIYQSACKILIDELAEIKNLSVPETLEFLEVQTGKKLSYVDLPGFGNLSSAIIKRRTRWGAKSYT